MASQLTVRMAKVFAPASFVICGAGLLPVGAAATADMILRCVSGSCSSLSFNRRSFGERRTGCRRLLVAGAASHNTAAIRKRMTARSVESAPWLSSCLRHNKAERHRYAA